MQVALVEMEEQGEHQVALEVQEVLEEVITTKEVLEVLEVLEEMGVLEVPEIQGADLQFMFSLVQILLL